MRFPDPELRLAQGALREYAQAAFAPAPEDPSRRLKPNRAVAWADTRGPSRFPLRDHNLRWLFRLPIPHKWQGIYFAAVGSDGVLSLWRYRSIDENDPGKGGGLELLKLSLGDSARSPETGFLRLTESAGAYDPARGFFHLERALCACDREGGIRVRLLSPGGEHAIAFDLAGADRDQVVGCNLQPPRPVRDARLHRVRQVGGWDDSEALYWDTRGGQAAGVLFSGSLCHPLHHALDGLPPGVPMRAAAILNDWVAAGGDDERLWIGRKERGALTPSPERRMLRGYVRSLAMVPRPETSAPFVLVGCDDHFLHILDERHETRQKVDLGGIPEALLPLNWDLQGGWYDLAVAVRDRGLMCLRLLGDRFKQDGPSRDDRDLLLDALERQVRRDPRSLRNWLRSPHSEQRLLGLALLLYRPNEHWDAIELPRDLPFDGLGDEVVEFATHVVKRRMGAQDGQPPLADGSACRHYLELLTHFAEGPYRTRLPVRRLAGWLLSVRDLCRRESDLSERVARLTYLLPDAKRALRRQARILFECIRSGRMDEGEKALGVLIALKERFRFKRLFNEIILAPPEASGRVDAVAIVRDRQGYGLQVFARRGGGGIESFRNRFDPESIGPVDTARDWAKLESAPGAADVRALLALGEERLLIVSEDAVRAIDCPIAPPPAPAEPRTLLLAADEGLGEIHSAAVCRCGSGFRAAVGLGWIPPGSTAALVLDLDPRGALVAKTPLSAPEGWAGRVRINAMAWDDRGRLWAATGGPGYLLRWERNPLGDWSVAKLLAVGSPQYALGISAAGSLVLGGEDGAVRAFTEHGRLQWVRILPGAILGISARSDERSSDYAPLAVITERDTVVLYDTDGRHLGMLELAGEHLTALASGAVAPANVRHHLLGTLRGDVRLLEEVPEPVSEDPLLFLDIEDTGSPVDWRRIAAVAREQVQRLGSNGALCRRWIAPEAAHEEPLRACAAARRMLALHGEFLPVLELLEHYADATDPHSRELRAHLFGALGAEMARFPEALDDRLVDLARRCRDGALASLIGHAPDDPGRPALWTRILAEARDKILDLGRPFTSGAVLQRYAAHPEESPRPGWLSLLLDPVRGGHRTLHPGFEQGILAVTLRRIGYADDGLLAPFARPADPEALTHELRADGDTRDALLDLLVRHSDVVLLDRDHRAWQALFPALRAESASLPERLRAAIDEAKDCPDAPDLKLLARHLALFPGERPDELTHWQADTLTELRKLTDALRQRLDRVHTLTLSLDDAEDELERLTTEVLLAEFPSPLVARVHDAWQEHWLEAIDRERMRIRQIEYLSDLGSDVPESTRQVFLVMREAGFRDGRYYEIRYFPETPSKAVPFEDPSRHRAARGLMTLKHWSASRAPVEGIAHSFPLSGVLAQRMGEYARAQTPERDRLICQVRPADPLSTDDAGLAHWNRVWNQKAPADVFEIPVIRRAGALGYRPVGLFVFNLPEYWDRTLADLTALDRTTPLIREALRPALRKAIAVIEAQERERSDEMEERYRELEGQLLSLYGPDATLGALLRTAVTVAGAEDGLLAVRSGVTGWIDVRGATERSQALFSGVRFRDRQSSIPIVNAVVDGQPSFYPDFKNHPHAETIDACLEERFAEAGRPGGSQQWLGQVGSLIALPVAVEGQTVGAISLRHSRPFRFDEHRCAAVQRLLTRYRWYFKVLQLIEDRRHWTFAFVHEVRSDLGMARHALEFLRDEIAEGGELLDTVERQVEKVFALAQNVLDTGRTASAAQSQASFSDAGPILGGLVRQYLAYDERQRPTFTLIPPDLDAPVWGLKLKGERAAFERIVRNLVDNAVKYGREDVRISARRDGMRWCLRISNPGFLTPEEDEIKFKPFVKPARPRFDGSHVGLAASLGLARAYGATLTLDNRGEPTDSPRVEASLDWPLVQDRRPQEPEQR